MKFDDRIWLWEIELTKILIIVNETLLDQGGQGLRGNVFGWEDWERFLSLSLPQNLS